MARRLRGGALGLLAPMLTATLVALPTRADDDLGDLALEDLLDVEITSVSKQAESLARAAASITVITRDEIRRSGATSIPEALRGVPGVQVARLNANRWAVATRGFNSTFSNKLLVLIDGRSVYSPLYAGVYWDAHNVRMDDVDRIEVIRGPGGTMWGANAVNGVINVITRKAQDTHGVAAEAGYGNLEPTLNARYGASLGGDVHWRTYFNGFDRQNLEAAGGGEAADGYRMYQGGLRMDWDMDADRRLMVVADGFGGEGAQTSAAAYEAKGGNLLTRLDWDLSDISSTSFQMYWDYTDRDAGLAEERHNFDVEVQHDWGGLDPMTLSWGANYRMTRDQLSSTGTTSFSPDAETFHVGTLFVQGQSELIEDVLVATAGTKLEYNSYTGFEYQPSGRLRWSPHDDHHLWTAISRAIRRPARTDRDLRLDVGFLVLGSRDFETEELLAFEAGYRTTALERVAFELSAFYFIYDNLVTVTPGAGGPFPPPPLTFSNGMSSDTYGFEMETTWQALDFLRLVGGYSLFLADSEIAAPATSIERPEDVNPEHQVSGRVLLDGPYRTELDTSVSWVSALAGNGFTQPRVEDYVRLDVRLGWRATEHWELSVVGQNLVEDEHGEFIDLLAGGAPVLVPRSVFGKVAFRY